MKVIDKKKETKVFEDICWQLDKEENEYLPQVEISDLVRNSLRVYRPKCAKFREKVFVMFMGIIMLCLDT